MADVPCPVTVEMAFGADPDGDPGDWVWTDLEDAPRRQPVTIRRGRSDESTRVQPSTCTVLLANTDGAFTPRNPMSPHWPNIRRGTPMRVSVEVDAVSYTRFVGHVASWEPAWPMATDSDDPSAGVSHVRVTAAGPLRRLGQGNRRLHSPLRRLVMSPGNVAKVPAYWPCEDGRNSLRASSPIPGVPPMVVGDADAFAGADGHPGSDPLLRFAAGRPGGWNGTVPDGPDLGHWRVEWMQRLGEDFTESTLTWFPIMYVRSRGRVARWQIMVDPTPDVAIAAWDADDTGVILDTGGLFTNVPGEWALWTLEVFEADSGVIDWHVGVVYMTGPFAGSGNAVLSGTYSGRAGRPQGIENVFAEAPVGDFEIGHIIVSTQTATGWLAPGDRGWVGERAAPRFARLCAEENVPVEVVGNAADSEPMGIQQSGSFLALLDECVAAEGSMMGEQVATPGLTMRTRAALTNQTPALDASMESRQLRHPFAPILDDRSLVNSMTTSRPEGSEFVAADAAHVQAEGDYSDSAVLNLLTDEQAMQHAWWRMHLGTWPEERWPGLALRPIGGGLVADWASVRPGDRLIARDLPRQQHGDVDTLVQGWSETLTGFDWRVEPNSSPAGPWTVGVLDDTGTPDTDLDRLTSDGTTVTAAVSDVATSLDVLTPVGPEWVNDTDHPDQFPLDVELSTGEVVTVTACTQPTPVSDVPVLVAADDFEQSVSAGWGVADPGGTWQSHITGSTDRSVSGGAGHVTLTGNLSWVRWQAVGSAVADVEVLLSFSADQLATGNDLLVAAMARYIPGEASARVQAELEPSGDVSLLVRDYTTPIGSSTPTGVTYAPDDVLWIRALVEADRVRGRLWVDGDPEPGTWLVDETVSVSTGPGQVGCTAGGYAGTTNTDPVLSVHSFEATELIVGQAQTMTVTRATNGIVKAVPVGADVQPARPFRLAL